ncbi:MAG: SPOR domain-containing protein, partial [Gemmatimonadota bacterium]
PTRSAALSQGPPAALRSLADLDTGERPYSVLIASYVRWEDALDHVDELERASTDAVFIAPTPVRQRVYYRVLSGALRDAAAADQFMQELVSSGRKEEYRRWDMRPVRLAYVIGDFRTLAEAYAEKSRLRGDRIPAYVLRGGSNGLPYRVYSGAFESTSAAADLGLRLRQAGHDVQLEQRRGTHP